MNESGKVLVRDVIDVIRSFAPENVQESWDNSGLSVGDADAEVTDSTARRNSWTRRWSAEPISS